MIDDIDKVNINTAEYAKDFIIGVMLSETAVGFRFSDVTNHGVINHFLGDIPIVIIADESGYYTYLSKVGEQALMFSIDGKILIDDDTLSEWDYQTGQAFDGSFQGEFLTPIPSLTATKTAWLDFYPHGLLYEP